MAQKSNLPFSLAQLQALSVAVLAALVFDVTGKAPATDATKDQVLDELLKVAEPAPEQTLVASKGELPKFKLGKKSYQVLIPRVEIPGIGIRTALELANDKEAQEYLIKANAVGSVIAEIVE